MQELYDEDRKTIETLNNELKHAREEIEFLKRKYKLMWSKTAMTFSQMILNLQNYWQEQGCAIMQPYDMPAGAGTFHPATFLRSLGKKPWTAAYVAPSRRPTDGRYGENPNRLGAYYQFQVLVLI